METMGALIDKLTVVNLKLWHQEEIAHDLKADDATVAAAKRKINVLNNQRNALMEEIDRFLYNAVMHREVPLFQPMKDYSKG